MADKTNPTGNTRTGSSELLPKYFRTDSNKKFLQATIDQLMTPGTVKKINGFVGRQYAKATTGDDIFIEAVSTNRQNYQLEPSIVVKDSLENTTFFKDYIDYINQVDVFGGNVKNHSRLNRQEFYSWDPHIDWDKFVNFQSYYWLPYGPDVIKIKGQAEKVESTYKITVQDVAGDNVYMFSPGGLVQNPTIKLYRGQTYQFEVSSLGNPFSIKTKRTAGGEYRYIDPGVINNTIESGTIKFTVPYSAPDILFYVSESNPDLGGVFEIASITEATSLNLETDLIGKKTYTLEDGTPLSNGMKVSFIGNVYPESYSVGQYYVSGVGDSITLINESLLELVSPYTESESILFDTTPFDSLPFGDATTFATSKDYIVIARGSLDNNPWSRYNRWFHKDVIEASANFNNKVSSLDQASRATRPIIEFQANVRLYNFGNKAIADVDLIDDYTTDVFSTIEGSAGYNIDGIEVANGQRILFTADNDRLVKNKIYKVSFITVHPPTEATRRQIHLTPEDDPVANDVVLVKQGKKNQGLMYWYDGSVWSSAQQKLTLNQPPLFDIVDDNGVSFGDTSVYDGSTFAGTKIFSYKVGTSGSNDSVLGFPLTYKNINNVGDILFEFNLSTDVFQYKDVVNIIEKCVNVGYLKKTLPTFEEQYINGWQTANVVDTQPAIRIYKNSNKVNNFEIDIFDDINDLDDLVVRVLLNGNLIDSTKWRIDSTSYSKTVVLATDVSDTDVVTIKAYTKQPVNSNGFYEIPINLEHNPLNDDLLNFTLGEVSSHVRSIVEELSSFVGSFPGPGNLRDLGNVTPYGTKFVQHSGPISLSLYHVTSETNNIIKAIDTAREEYNKFKKNFIAVAENLGVDSDPVRQVNLILQEINKDKPKTFPYYFSDMIPYSGAVRTDLTVIDYRIKTYPLASVFTLTELSGKAVLVYLNGNQLLYGKDYTFSDQGFVIVSATIENDDTITIYEYENTNGCFVPPTPTKLGIWPKYEPKIYTDTSLVTPREMIQGHDGSQVLAYGDYRDDLILELEKRIFNNIKISYDTSIFDFADLIPSYNKDSVYSLDEFNEVLAPSFYKWATLIDRDFSKPLSYDRNNTLTYNYRDHTAPDGRETPGYWRGIYRWMLGTDRPNIAPWEMLGFTIQPDWWETVYGPAPYTSDNLVLWSDLANGLTREPGKPVTQNSKYIRTYLLDHIPVDNQGNISSPYMSGLSNGINTLSTAGDFVFGDVSPVEAAWRRSSHYPFSVLLTSMLLQPAKTFGVLLDRSRVVKNNAGQIVYKDTKLRIKPSDIKLPSIFSSTTNVRTSGIINYLVDYILSDNLKSYSEYAYDLSNIQTRLSHRVGSFSSKEKFNLLLDSKSPVSQGSVFVPQEDYELILNSSSPIKKITYSGVIITKLEGGFEVKGYSKVQPYFKYYPYTRAGVQINVGGISESFTAWASSQQYAAGKIVEYGGRYFRVKTLHTTTSAFNQAFYQQLPSLPIIGGRDAYIRRDWDKSHAISVPYGTKFTEIQDVVDFLLGYGEWLKDEGFVFDDFNNALNVITNWETSAKEFLFWTTQNWSSGEDKWEEWLPDQAVPLGAIRRYNGDYYRALRNVEPDIIFDDSSYVKLDGLSTVGSSVLSLSPAAEKLTFSTPYAVVDDIRNPFNGYEIFKVDGTPIEPNFINNYREDNTVSYTPIQEGIFGATFYLVQKEHVVVLKNNTLFNDTIYNPASGYRQERIRVAGYISTGWYGAFNIPGFIFDQATIQEWEGWTDYALGDIVKYKQFYYSAKSSIPGNEVFDATQWIKLDTKPTPALLPNWTYKAGQFTDFYSLDSDNFDADQQAVAQHLIGYQKRQYLSNIIKDDVSEYKFYQGMIVEKGTKNVLNKLFDVLSADNQESVTFYEEWALRVGQYGASGAFENIEFVINEAEVKTNPQAFELVSQVDPYSVDFVSRQTPNDIYLKPLGYNSNPWPTVSSYVPYLRTPGYVRTDEVKLVLNSIDEIYTTSIDGFVDGDYVWVGFEGREWNVYRFSNLNLTVTDVTYSSQTKELTIELDKTATIPDGLVIGIDQVTGFSGFYKVTKVILNKIVVTAASADVASPFTEQSNIVIGGLFSHRVSSIDVADTVLTTGLKSGDKIWTDDNGSGKWATWEYNPVYESSELVNTLPSEGLGYGRRVAINADGTIALISNYNGEIVVYDKAGPYAPWLQRQTILPPFISQSPGLGLPPTLDSFTGDVLAVSTDNTWLATGTPTASLVANKFKGDRLPLTTYLAGDIVRNYTPGQPIEFWQAIQNVPLIITNYALTHWKKISYIPVDETGVNANGFTNQGVVSIYKKDSNNIYTLVDTILSPFPSANEYFGSSVAFANDTLYVGATGYNSNQGKVYQLDYGARTQATASYNPIGSSGTTLILSNVSGIIAEGMLLSNPGFTNGQYVAQVVDSNTLIINEAPDSTIVGTIEFTTISWAYNSDVGIEESIPSNSEFGKEVKVSADSSTLVITAPGVTASGKVFVYSLGVASYTLLDTLVGSDVGFGSSVAISSAGQYLIVSSPSATVEFESQGDVSVYERSNSGYNLIKSLTNTKTEVAGFFGTKVSFMNDYETIVVYSQGADNVDRYAFDAGTTTFDDNLTNISDITADSGRIDVYDRYGSTWIFSESLLNPGDISTGYATGISANAGSIMVGAPTAYDPSTSTVRSGKVYEYRKAPNTMSWVAIHTENNRVDVNKIKRAFLYNKATNKLVTYLDVIDPSQGKIPGPAEQEIKYKTFYDPATYSSGDSTVNVDEGMAWNKPQVGTLWWDLRTAKFIDSNDDSLLYRNSTWNTLFDGASIDIYEWVESTLTPAQWNAKADTEEGIAAGISGQSLYGTAVYGLVKRYDNISKTFKNKYYYWVKNKKTIPNVPNRTLSAQDVADLISNPRGYGYKYIALTSTNSFSLVNVKQLLNDTNVVLSVEYWINDRADGNIHNQYKIISNHPSTVIPTAIEQKWFDSLCGKDSAGRVVPDTALPPKLRYGIEARPRQGMFVNRFEALKQFIEEVNNILSKELIVENRDISQLNSYESQPSTITGLYDDVIDSNAELRLTNIGTYGKPSVTPIIVDGRITGINIVEKGSGYLVAPYFTITGSGTGAKIRAILDVSGKGQIIGAEVISSGSGYDSNTIITVRNYSILVQSDDAANGNWSIYAYEPTTLTWSRVQSQSYDVRTYWSYADWYATGYNEFVAIDHSVDSFASLNGLEDTVGQLVKVRNTSLGTWALLKKYSDIASIDWTQQYNIVGREKGTIQFSKNLYTFDGSPYGFDGSLYDSAIFDNSASTELRIILNALRDNILIDTLKQNYLDIFFNSIRYVFHEQNYVDWIFKTSFVKAQHNIGGLTQKVTYNNDNLENFEDFISEVKPYRTKIREYVSNYSNVDQGQITTTDFDLQPIFENGRVLPISVGIKDGEVIADSNQITAYPWKHWYDNLGYKVVSLKIISGGSGYITEPVVRFVNFSGSGATARAFIANGKVNRISLLTKGTGYLEAPQIVIDGGLEVGGTPATVVAIIGEGVVRSNLIKVKFDRVTQHYFITKLEETESIPVLNGKLQYNLAWAPDLRIGKTTVLVNGVEVLRADYKLSITKSTTRGYTSYYGTLTFDTAPALGTIEVSYIKDWSLLNAADRIQYYYDPATGELGKDLAQLMSGVDYGGVVVSGLGFESNTGWGSAPYYTDKWGSYDDTFEDYITVVSANTHSFQLPYVPESGQAINVYYSGKNTDGPYISDGIETIYTFNVNSIYPPTVTVTRSATVVASGTNVAGSTVLTINSTTGIKEGDQLTITPYVQGMLGYNTVVTNIISSTEVKLDQILFSAVPAGSTATFTRVLVDPVDCIINKNGTVFLNDPVTSGSVITITAPFAPVRLDDPNYTLVNSYYETLTLRESELTVLNGQYSVLINEKATIENTIASLTAQLVPLTATLNALNVAISGLTPSDPQYAVLLADIVTTTNSINSINGQIATQNTALTNKNSSISAKQIEITGKEAQIVIAQAAYDAIDPIANTSAIMQTWVGDGIEDTIDLPLSFTVNDGDKFIFRKPSSDGAVKPQETDYDTALSGGAFNGTSLTSATGLSADDIIVDGDGFVTPTSSPATEEVVPGQVVDAVAIKVYDRPRTGSANIKVDSYIADGVTTDYVISQQPNSPTAIIVKFTEGNRDDITGKLLSVSTIKTLTTDYIVDYRNRLVKFVDAPPAGVSISIFSFGFNGSKILDLDYFIGDGTTTEFITKAHWESTATYLVYVDGEPPQPGTPQLFKTDSSYESQNRMGLLFSVAPAAGSLINYVIVSGSEQTFSITKAEKIPATGTNVYNLSYDVGNALPAESHMIVRVDQTILKGPNNSYFTITGTKLNYTIDPTKFLPYSLSISDIVVYAGGDLLHSGVDYTVELSGITVKINNAIRKQYLNQELVVQVLEAQSYTYIPRSGNTPPRIQFDQSYSAPTVIEVISSYNHDILDIQRTAVTATSGFELTIDTPEYYKYKAVSGGIIQLDRPVKDDNYIWVVKSGALLVPSIDFKLNDDKTSITLATYPDPADEFTLITYGSNVLTSGVSYMQFKDMLNRTHFKRLNANKQTRLLKELAYNDTNIYVEDGSTFDLPSVANNKPGIVEIRGERIEYFDIQQGTYNGNPAYILTRLRRGTLGTGVSTIHPVDSFVQDIGASETIPYADITTIDQITSDGTSVVPLNFVPSSVDEIEVFVGGYSTVPWASAVNYAIGDIVEVGSYTYRCTADHLSSSTFNSDVHPITFNQDGTITVSDLYIASSNAWTFFVGNIRLKKHDYEIHDVNLHQESPEGNRSIDADFTVDGTTAELHLTNLLKFGTKVTVIRKSGVNWDGKPLPDGTTTPSILEDTTKIAKFVKAVPGIWYTSITKV